MSGHTLKHHILMVTTVRDVNTDGGHGDEAAVLLLVHRLRGDHVADTGAGDPRDLGRGHTGTGATVDGEVVSRLGGAGTSDAQVTGGD